MTITLNAASKAAGLVLSGSSSGSLAINAGAGANRLLVVMAFQRGGAIRTFSSFDYNGDALTQVSSVALEESTATKLQASIWYLVAPDTGTNNLNVTMSGNTTLEVHACVFEGAAQTSPLDKESTATSAGSTTPGASVTQPATDGQVVVAGQAHEGLNASTVSTGTSLQDIDQGAWNTSSAYVIQTTAAAQTIDWSNGESLNWAAAIASFKAAAAGATPLTVADVSLALASEAPALTQHNALEAQDIWHNVTMDGPVMGEIARQKRVSFPWFWRHDES